MPVLGDLKFNWDKSCREAEFIRWKKNAHRNLKINKKKTDKECQVAFLCDWLGATGERVLEGHNGLKMTKKFRHNMW